MKINQKYALIASLSLNILGCSAAIALAFVFGEKIESRLLWLFCKADVIMIGDSLTEGGEWSRLLNNVWTVKIARGGLESKHISYLVSEAKKFHPKFAFVLCGANDLKLNDTVFYGETLMNYKEIIDSLRAYGIRPVYQTVPYRFNDREINKVIDKLNLKLIELASAEGVDVIDLRRELSDSTGLPKSITTDGTHLNGDGYKKWAAVINEYLKKHSNKI